MNVFSLSFFGCILFFILNTTLLQAQDTAALPKQQIEFRHDNDFIIFTDQYYSSGLLLTYRRHLASGIFTKDREQFTVELKQEAHTPSNVDTEDILKIDRPYAGFSGLTLGWSLAGEFDLLEVRTLVGLTGPSSGAGGFQRWHHKNIVFISVPTWFTEIEDSFHANLEVSYALEWELTPVPFGVWLALKPSAAYGTKDIYVQPQFIASFGRRNTIGRSIAFHQVGSMEREIYFSFSFGYRFVGHNALLQGNALGDKSLYTIEPNDRVRYVGFDFRHRFGKNDYKFGYRYNSPEAPEMDNHKYIILSYARSF